MKDATNSMIKVIVIGGIIGFIASFITWEVQNFEFSQLHPEVKLELTEDKSSLKMVSCISSVMNHKEDMSLKDYKNSLNLCIDNHIKKEEYKKLLNDFVVGKEQVLSSYDLEVLKKSEKEVAEMLKKIKTKKKK